MKMPAYGPDKLKSKLYDAIWRHEQSCWDEEKRRISLEIGEYIEQLTRSALKLRKERSADKYCRPDILDYNCGIVGEVKSMKKKNQVVLKKAQMEKYAHLCEKINSLSVLNGAGKSTMRPMYFIGYYLPEYTIDDPLLEIFVLNDEIVNHVLNAGESNQTCWNLEEWERRKVRLLKDEKQQIFGLQDRKKLKQHIVENNTDGAYYRLGIVELRRLCPEDIACEIDDVQIHSQNNAPLHI